MKLLGKILIALLSLLLATSIILWILAKNINPEIIKQQVNNQITALTHKSSHINGSISWQLFPRPGIKFSKILIGNEQISEEYSLTIDTMLLNLKITPLLRGQFIFSELIINGLKTQINLDIAPVFKASEESTNYKNNKDNDNKQFAIKRLLISHGQIIIIKNGHTTVFKNLQIGVEDLNLQNTPFTVQIKAKLNEYASNPLVKAGINFKGRLSLAPTLVSHLHTGFSQFFESSYLEGQLLLQNVLWNQFSIKKISATIKTNKTGVLFNPFTLSLYQGESVGKMNYSIATQQFSLNQTATNLNGTQLMKVLLGNEKISGTLDYTIHATIPLKNPNIENIAGKGTITIKDGEIYNLNLDQLLNYLKEKLIGFTNSKHRSFNKSVQLSEWDKHTYNQDSTAFKLAGIQYQFRNGIFNSESILLQTMKLQVKGKGTINLTNQEMNSTLQISLNNNNAEPAMQKIQQILGGYFPLIVSGTLDKPEVLPDFKMIN